MLTVGRPVLDKKIRALEEHLPIGTICANTADPFSSGVGQPSAIRGKRNSWTHRTLNGKGKPRARLKFEDDDLRARGAFAWYSICNCQITVVRRKGSSGEILLERVCGWSKRLARAVVPDQPVVRSSA